MSARRASAPKRRRRWLHVVWVLPVLCAIPSGIRVARYQIPVFRFMPTPSANPAATTRALPLAGALHVHSTRSDGRGTPDEIAEQAKAAGLDFVVLNDHNVEPEPTRLRAGVLFLQGAEITTRDGHLLAFDFAGKPPPAGTPAHDAARVIHELGGFSAVAHGHDPKAPWQRWDLRRLDGLEIYNAGADARRHLRFPWNRLVGAALSFPLNPDFALLLLQGRSDRDLAQLDARMKTRDTLALCGLDAHGLPSYGRLFRAMRTYVRATRSGDAATDARAIFGALRAGRHYCAVELYGDGSRFAFTAAREGVVAGMGDTLPAGTPVVFRATLGVSGAESAELRLLRNGEEITRALGSLTHAAAEPGAYRVEVTLPVPGFFGFDERRTFIYSNAIYIRGHAPQRGASDRGRTVPGER